MHLIPLLSLILPLAAHAAIHDPCDAGGIPGICVTTSTCAVTDGTSRSGFCPNDPSDVKCCTTKCGPGQVGMCRYNDTCGSGATLTGLCPGPNNFQCCLPEGATFTSPLPPPSSGSSNSSSVSSTSPVSSFSPISTFSGVLNGTSFPLSSSSTGRPTSSSQSESASPSSSSVNATDGGDAAGSDPGGAGRTVVLDTSLGLAMALVGVVAGL